MNLDWLNELSERREKLVDCGLIAIKRAESVYFKRVQQVFSEFFIAVGFPQDSFDIEVECFNGNYEVWLKAFGCTNEITAPVTMLAETLRAERFGIPYATKTADEVSSFWMTPQNESLQWIKIDSEKRGDFVMVHRHDFAALEIYDIMRGKA